ncbi:helix-turn-helix domain-containing protein [Actinoplanes sp. TBRC 11911]|uniref:helix-turn-helix transcriptional regulator n=1 Tax=Actinoplanes sp. TBRC 11911 TaxID=2729386 RepID=UPI00145ED733|nr:helix-turn-helix transcriptional regulator [Actinoplanes sp. TBRC 11911]NMO51707.1 helix-turn-helix domain-containing protein [Actinoplanes sp. TBRC 11911]
MGVNRMTDLGDFLRSRRAALNPADAGVPTVGRTRRVPGLRRAEVALLAGMSVNYYTRIEQGEIHQMSDSVVAAIARALRLDDTERHYLNRLAWPAQRERVTAGPETVRDSLVTLIEARTDEVAFVIGRRLDILAGNALAYALIGAPRVNVARKTFLDPAARDFWVDWEGHAREITAHLRTAASDSPGDPRFGELIHELSAKSPDFVRLWAEHPVADCAHNIREYNHPAVGRLTLHDESLRIPDAPGQRLNFMTAAPGSASAEGLRRLAAMA